VGIPEREEKILSLLKLEPESAPHLASVLGVSTNTIRRDIDRLSHKYCIRSKAGKNGGLVLEGWDQPQKPNGNLIICPDEQEALRDFIKECLPFYVVKADEGKMASIKPLLVLIGFGSDL